MRDSTASPATTPFKAPTGIEGFDEMTGGGLPAGRMTLLLGGPGSGKTIFALQFLMFGAKYRSEPSIFVAFEETSNRLIANSEGFGWGLGALVDQKALFFLDAQPAPDTIHSGDFDLSGMLAALGAQVAAMGARRIVFDALDIVLALLPDAAARRREVYRLHDWLLERDLTGIFTAKAGGDEASSLGDQTYTFVQFMVDCAVMLNHRVSLGISQRNLRVQKYRGSSFDENESPFVIGKEGFDVAIACTLTTADKVVSDERVSSGVERLDTMLSGGYYRGSSVLITGFPGTAKTTLSGTFAQAACLRGEKTLFISFDSDAAELVRNLGSVNIRLRPFIENRLLQLVSARTITGSAETLLVRIRTLAREHGARCIVIDPVSTLSKAGNELTAHGVVERLIDWTKANGVTLVCTSLLDDTTSRTDAGTPLQISTLADTWIHLNYLSQAGERNRGLSVIKSRGMAHSNQVRELTLDDSGVTLTDAYTAGGEVLMGAMRWQKESEERLASEEAQVAAELRRLTLEAEEAILEVRATSLQTELIAKQVEKSLLARTSEARSDAVAQGKARLRELRGADGSLEDDPRALA